METKIHRNGKSIARSVFSAQQTFKASGEFIPAAMKSIREAFEEKGYRFNVKSESYGRTIVEVQRGCVLHQALGLRNGLEITFTRNGDETDVEVRDCLVENQLVGPALLFYYVPKLRIPIAVTESIGLLMQVNLPEKAMEVIRAAYEDITGKQPVYCPFCGARVTSEDGVCGSCGRNIIADVTPIR